MAGWVLTVLEGAFTALLVRMVAPELLRVHPAQLEAGVLVGALALLTLAVEL